VAVVSIACIEFERTELGLAETLKCLRLLSPSVVLLHPTGRDTILRCRLSSQFALSM
jgi:hypothetical protein